jgi:methyl-accepting chemotaxis protein
MRQTSLETPLSPDATPRPRVRRASLRRQLLLGALLPLLLVGVLLSTLTALNASSAVVSELRARAESVAGVTAESVYEDLERVDNPVYRADLNATAAFNLRAIRDGAFIAIASPEGIVVVAARSGLGSKRVQESLERATFDSSSPPFVAVGTERFVVARQSVLKYDGTGSLGRVYIGLETGAINDQLWRVLLPTLGLLLLALAVAAALAMWLASRISRRIVAATQIANRISLGDLETQITEHASDEVGDLTRALERMRYSLKFMIERSKRSK